MDSTVFGWRDELKNYIRSIEVISETALKSIKQDRIRNHLPFDDSFKSSILGLTSGRIANVFTNLMYEDILDDGQNLLPLDDNYQNDGYVPEKIGQQFTSTNISPESIEQMPIILVPSKNQNLASNATATPTFVLGDNQIISVASNQLQLPSVPSQMEISSSQVAHAQSIQTEISKIGGVSKEKESRMEVEYEMVAQDSLIEVNTNVDTEYLNTIANGMVVASTSSGANDVKCHELLEQPVKSNKQRSDTIDLTSDQEDVADNLNGNIQLNVPQPMVERPNLTMKKFKCHVCPYSTMNKTHLTNHIRIHTGERPYECKACKRRFTVKQNLNSHMKIHRKRRDST